MCLERRRFVREELLSCRREFAGGASEEGRGGGCVSEVGVGVVVFALEGAAGGEAGQGRVGLLEVRYGASYGGAYGAYGGYGGARVTYAGAPQYQQAAGTPPPQ